VAAVAADEEIVERLATRLEPGDVLITMGAGDIRKTAESVKRRLVDAENRQKAREYHESDDRLRKTAAAC
jgi:hypothetical protein